MRIQYWAVLMMLIAVSWTAAAGERKPANTTGRSGKQIKLDFLRSTHLSEGKTTLVSIVENGVKKDVDPDDDDDNCQSGTLRVLEFDRDATLMLGAHSLVEGIGAESIVETERGCKGTLTATYSENHAEGNLDRECGGVMWNFHVTVDTIGTTGFRYRRVVKGPTPEDLTCEYKYKR